MPNMNAQVILQPDLRQEDNLNIKPINTQTLKNALGAYACYEKHSWNPFHLLRKRKLNNSNIAYKLAEILSKDSLSDEEIIKIANSIKGFEDRKLQEDLFSYLQEQITRHQQSFLKTEENFNKISTAFIHLMNKTYKPWWTFFLIEMPYFSLNFRELVQSSIHKINDLFKAQRPEVEKNLLRIYNNKALTNQIMRAYQANFKKKFDDKDKLEGLLNILLKQSLDKSKRELLQEIKSIIKQSGWGNVLLSAAGLTFIIHAYISNKENFNKPKKVQAQEIFSIICTIVIKSNAGKLAESFLPGAYDVADVLVSVTASNAPHNPLDTDRKLGTAIAAAAGASIGGVFGSAIPVVGTYFGMYVGTVASRTAATRFFQALESWQKAPRGNHSIIPRYSESYLSPIDNDKQHILEPLYKSYLKTERQTKSIGDQVAKWLSIYSIVKSSPELHSKDSLECIDTKMRSLQKAFHELKNNHARIRQTLYKKPRDNQRRIDSYSAETKECLAPLYNPLKQMLDEYFISIQEVKIQSNSPSETACPSTVNVISNASIFNKAIYNNEVKRSRVSSLHLASHRTEAHKVDFDGLAQHSSP